jgi:dolichol-phosphate mannosyltransferase
MIVAKKPQVIAIIPVYEENENLLKVLRKFRRRFVNEICVVADQIDEQNTMSLMQTSKCVVPIKLIKNAARKGVGHAIKQGLKYAIDQHYDIAVILAGNNKDEPSEIPRLIEPIINENYDYIQGSRFLIGGSRINNPHIRGAFSRLYPYIWTLSTNVRCTDVTNGFRALKLKILADPQIDMWQGWLDGYEFEYYLLYKALTLGYRTKEVPVSKIYPYRHKGGYSKISPFRDWWKIVSPLIYLRLGMRK